MVKNKRNKISTEIKEEDLKSLGLFESTDGNFNEYGYFVTYTRIPNGVIRTIGQHEGGLDQLFIPLPASYFVIKQ